ncbi:SIT4 phosphatase-associated protein-domain-containing protein [Cokeromyces recurvatus]|uniref:SIT4 phosphatase-associated protein-domain-containing protein n=1 Tax=Cokeromyces recurvatus TaxID=90255 RepID=UPI00221F7768|nr:SIT4 phosphatase-associated protein-domain-containing protein [Cokeromyces recurvatus]KAI7900933.1 SIT4 phosphatase-associated protein-domain-containing protein [Cokeromyces recurvatus]
MFWRFGFNSSTLDSLLDKDDVTLEDILEEEDILQEAKTMNPKLVNFLSKPEIIKALLNYIVSNDLEENKRFKYPFLASEIIACEIQSIIEAIVIEHKQDLLVPFWSYLDQPSTTEGLDSLQASYFCKTIGVLLSKYPSELMTFIQSDSENLNKILSHLQTSAIMDLLLTLIRMEELPEGKGVVKWLSEHGLLVNLVDRLNPYLDTEEHSIAQQCICDIIRLSQTSLPESQSIGNNDLIMELKSEAIMQKLANFMLDPNAPNATSTLINGVSIIIDLIRHNNSDLENDPSMTAALYDYQLTNIPRSTVSLGEMLKVMANHISDFTHLLLKPRSVHGTMQTTLGELEPLGFERLKICELFAELLHCSNMSNLNEIHYEQYTPNQQEQQQDDHLSVGDYLKSKFVENRAMPICIDLFFAFPWNNFLHYVIYDMLHQVFNGRMDIGLNRHLAISILKDGQLTEKIIAAQKSNDEACAKPKGMRAGYMGHLTFISDEIIKLFEGYPETIVQVIKDDIDMEGWNHYCQNELKDTKERDQLPLGGLRPNNEDDLQHSEDEEDEEEDEEDVAMNGLIENNTAASQYSRFLAQRGGEEGHFDDNEEDTNHWIAGRDDFTNKCNSIQINLHSYDDDDDEEEEEYNSNNEDEEDAHFTPDWTRNFSKFSQPTSLRRIPSHNNEHPKDIDDDNNAVDVNDDDDDFDHLADAEELERRTSLRYRIASSNKIQNDDDDDDFGEFESATEDNNSQQWNLLTENLEQLDINPLTDDDVVRAIKTKEENGLKEYQHDEEQEGEV